MNSGCPNWAVDRFLDSRRGKQISSYRQWSGYVLHLLFLLRVILFSLFSYTPPSIDQEQLKHELEEMTVALASCDAEIVRLNAQLLQAQAEGPGAGELVALKAQNERLNVEVKSLTQQLLIQSEMLE
ncbi:hypothetical protein MTR67_042770 [Solanum verrucosum]|uniref:Uncharacterized protein n=1 Tax=Solanum verrucosum TaxID=315347 RepID=A0AAF0ZU14_SOLVR|nr:hypothetical protein MTR67_042770 [Solanum verrucosum]